MRQNSVLLAHAAAATIGLLTVVGALLVALAATQKCHAHEAPPSKVQPFGWAYGWDCCSLMDCRPLTPGQVAETKGGYVIKLTGETIPYGDTRIKRSRDELFHQCTQGGDPKAKRSICLYVPEPAF